MGALSAAGLVFEFDCFNRGKEKLGMFGRIREVVFGVVLCAVCLPAAQGGIVINGGPAFPPPGGVAFEGSGNLGGLGVIFSFSGIDLTQTANLYWGISNTGVTGLSMDRGSIKGTAISGFEGGYVNGVSLVLLGSTTVQHFDDGVVVTTPVDTRLTITLLGGVPKGGGWIVDETTSGLTVPGQAYPTALVRVNDFGDSFSVQLRMEARLHDGEMKDVYRPYLDVFNELNTVEGAGAVAEFAGGFYWEELSTSAVPEPTSLAILGLAGCLMGAGVGRKRWGLSPARQ